MLKFRMSESLKTTPENPSIIIPAAIGAVIEEFDAHSDAYTVMDVHSALLAARQTLNAPSPAENSGAWAEVLAFGLTGTEHGEKPWGTYFGPMGSGTRENGEVVYFPDVQQADVDILAHWKVRARCVTAPLLSARYNDLAWDMGKLIANERRDVEFARRAADAYLITASQDGRDAYHAFPDAERALALAIQIDDKARRDSAREALLALHWKAIIENKMWWKAWDALEKQPKSGLTDVERGRLISDLEEILIRASNPTTFNPHDVESVANKLIRYYRRIDRHEEIKRLHLAVARAFERFGNMADPSLASMVFQTSMDAYRQAGRKEDEVRLLRRIEESNVKSVAQMTRHEVKQEIPAGVVEEFLNHIVGATKEDTLIRIAGYFLTSRSKMEEELKGLAKSSPLAAIIPHTKLNGDRVVAHIGSLDEDPMGRLIDHTNLHLRLSTPWLGLAMDHAKERHKLGADDIAAWANRTGLFGSGALLREGLAAWLLEDFAKAAHILVPQVESGFRKLIGHCGRPTTKAHPQMRQARMVITLGEILFQEETAPALGEHGPDIVLHFRALYADPRGYNLRNDLAHGLIAIENLNADVLLWVIHSLLLLGGWLKPAMPQAASP